MFASCAVLGATPRALVGGASERANAAAGRASGVAHRRAVVATAGARERAACRLPTAAGSACSADEMKMFARLRGPARARASGRHRGVPRGRIMSVTTRAMEGDGALDGVDGADTTDTRLPAKRSVWYGRGLLIFVAAAYGSLSVAFKYVYGMPGPPSAGVIGAVRGVFAALCFVPMILRESKDAEARAKADPERALASKSDGSSGVFWRAAGELALWNLVAQGACNVALLFTDATRVSFLTQASIAFTPVLVSLSGDRVGAVTWAGCFLAIAGVVLLGFDGGEVAAGAAAAAAGLNLGDVIALIGAASYSLYIFRIGAFAKKGLPGNLTQAWKTVILSVLYLGWAAADCFAYVANPAVVAAPWAGWQNPAAWAVLIFTAVVPGYFADVCQAKGQESVDASESQVLLAGEPLFAAVMGAVLLGESLGTFGYVGGAGLVAGAILAGFDEGGETETKAT
jgi:drug/metabolite transporter (DMT)-like permease